MAAQKPGVVDETERGCDFKVGFRVTSFLVYFLSVPSKIKFHRTEVDTKWSVLFTAVLQSSEQCVARRKCSMVPCREENGGMKGPLWREGTGKANGITAEEE